MLIYVKRSTAFYQPLVQDADVDAEPEVIRLPGNLTHDFTDNFQVELFPVNQPNRPLTIEETVKLALGFCFLWFIANWTLNAALAYTSVASATVLSGMSGESFLLLHFISGIIVPSRHDDSCHWTYVPRGNSDAGQNWSCTYCVC